MVSSVSSTLPLRSIYQINIIELLKSYCLLGCHVESSREPQGCHKIYSEPFCRDDGWLFAENNKGKEKANIFFIIVFQNEYISIGYHLSE